MQDISSPKLSDGHWVSTVSNSKGTGSTFHKGKSGRDLNLLSLIYLNADIYLHPATCLRGMLKNNFNFLGDFRWDSKRAYYLCLNSPSVRLSHGSLGFHRDDFYEISILEAFIKTCLDEKILTEIEKISSSLNEDLIRFIPRWIILGRSRVPD